MEEEPTIEHTTYTDQVPTVDERWLAIEALVEEMSRRHGLI